VLLPASCSLLSSNSRVFVAVGRVKGFMSVYPCRDTGPNAVARAWSPCSDAHP
jgi:hypothetical protein